MKASATVVAILLRCGIAMPANDAAPIPDREAAVSNGAPLPLRTWLRLLTCMVMTEAMIRARLHARFATTLPRFDALAALDAAGTELTMWGRCRRG
ncbi:MAG TPA: hypothetical protein VND19_19280 [Acetobacteraceae bacterium]|nr:hypothetical protein [Acetobacteraceae bacterium]